MVITKNIVILTKESFMDALLKAYHYGHHSTVESCFHDDMDWSNIEDIVIDLKDNCLISEIEV